MRTMRLITTLLLLTSAWMLARASDEADAVAAVQKLFDGMAARDAALIRSTILPDARLYSVREDGTTSPSMAGADFAGQIAAIQDDILERFTGKPSVSMRGRMAQVWGEYEFLRNGKFNHCGVDSFSLFKTADGWKIATVVYTSEIAGCKSR